MPGCALLMCPPSWVYLAKVLEQITHLKLAAFDWSGSFWEHIFLVGAPLLVPGAQWTRCPVYFYWTCNLGVQSGRDDADADDLSSSVLFSTSSSGFAFSSCSSSSISSVTSNYSSTSISRCSPIYGFYIIEELKRSLRSVGGADWLTTGTLVLKKLSTVGGKRASTKRKSSFLISIALYVIRCSIYLRWSSFCMLAYSLLEYASEEFSFSSVSIS